MANVSTLTAATGEDIGEITEGWTAPNFNSYLTFCDIHHLPVAPTPDILSFYMVFMSHYIQSRSVENYLTGIVSQLQPHFPEVHEARDSILVYCTLHGSPIIVSIFFMRSICIHGHSPSMTWPGSRCFSGGLFDPLRLGELVWPDSDDLREYSQLSPRSSVQFDDSSFTFTVPCRKSDTQYEGHSIRITHSHLLDDPYQIFSQYLAFRDALFPLHPLLWIRANGTVPTRAFSARFRTAFPDPFFGGHSLLSGSGGWSSSAWQRYIHRHPVLLRTLLFHGRPISLS
ncbi:hypothetical protein F5141DRAFT_999916 [Pisolithus sp. B1]|nr:hypothetical protein F5141DRAFT_999916 [Pisolithus sp. B1]